MPVLNFEHADSCLNDSNQTPFGYLSFLDFLFIYAFDFICMVFAS